MINSQKLKELGPEKASELLSQLSPKELIELKHTWHFWARENQIEPKGDWLVWFLNCGRGFGKTRTGAETCRLWVKRGMKRIAAVASTNSDIERVMVKGESGLLSICHDSDRLDDGTPMGRPRWSPTKRTLTWEIEGRPEGDWPKIEFYSAEEPERLRGPQFEGAWCDELAAWNKDEETWDMLQFCLRLRSKANENKPKVIVTTTPKSTKLVRKLIKDPYTHVTNGSSYDNAENLAESYLENLTRQYEGTRLGRQELYAEILAENEGALWTGQMIEDCQIKREDLPDLERVVVAIDPATSSNVESDDTGIIVAGIDKDKIGYILEDHTFKGLPEAWASKAISLYYEWGASRIVYESNQGKDLIPTVMRAIDDTVALRGVWASKSKIARAEPISALYERGKVKHVSNPESGQSLSTLEVQMTTYEPLGKHKSPDRYDAAVWALTNLMLKSRNIGTIKLIQEEK